MFDLYYKQGNSGLDNNSSGPKGDVGSPGVQVWDLIIHTKHFILVLIWVFYANKLNLMHKQGEPGPDGFVGEAGDTGRPVSLDIIILY